MHRRAFVIRAAATACLAPWSGVLGCTDPEGTEASDGNADTGTGTGNPGSSTGREASTTGTATSSSTTNVSSSSSAGSSSSESSSSTGSSEESTTGMLDSGTSPPSCMLSPQDIEGPFYRTRIPSGGDLDVHEDPGSPLVLEGQVLNENCQPIEGALVEIWHATPVSPGGMPGDAEAEYDDTAAYRYYGQVTTDSAGAYAFNTLRPGWYLNGDAYRPAHVHVKVWVDGEARLTTQLYFEDDPFNDADPWFNPDMAIAPDEDGAATIDLIV